jgi:hypothetical protein
VWRGGSLIPPSTCRSTFALDKGWLISIYEQSVGADDRTPTRIVCMGIGVWHSTDRNVIPFKWDSSSLDRWVPAIAFVRNTMIRIPLCHALLLSCVGAVAALARAPARRYRRSRRGLCLNCGYDLRGNVSGVCPECGRPVATRVNSAPTSHGDHPHAP